MEFTNFLCDSFFRKLFDSGLVLDSQGRQNYAQRVTESGIIRVTRLLDQFGSDPKIKEQMIIILVLVVS